MSPGVGSTNGDAVGPAMAQSCEHCRVGLRSTVDEIANGEELRIGTQALHIRHALAATRSGSDLVDGQNDGQMHTMIAFIVDIRDPVVTEILLDAELPLLEIRKCCVLRQLGGTEGGFGETGGNQRLTVGACVGAVGGNALIQLEGWGYAGVGALEGCTDGRGRGESGGAVADAWELIDSVAATDDGVAEHVVVEAGARQDACVDIGNEAVGRAVEPCELNSTLFAGGGVDDVRVEGVHIAVLLGEGSVELIPQTEIESQFCRDSVIVLGVASEVVEVFVEDGIGGADTSACGETKFEVGNTQSALTARSREGSGKAVAAGEDAGGVVAVGV